jgi:hypothetical protein
LYIVTAKDGQSDKIAASPAEELATAVNVFKPLTSRFTSNFPATAELNLTLLDPLDD